jgi:adenosine kinase
MAILVSGSLAFDTISNFGGRFAEQILPQQLHILNVSFYVPTLRREFGGCAGNIAYNLALLGAQPVVTAAVGADGQDYVARMRELKINVDAVRVEAASHTALAFIITDADNNQITAFHPGAMDQSHHIQLPQGVALSVGLVGPDGREAMLTRAKQLKAAGVPFVFDPGQGLPMFDGATLRAFIDQATWVAVNDYEASMLCERTGMSLGEISKLANIRGVVATLAAQGCDVWERGVCQRMPGVTASAVIDPTGCGDAFRAGLLYGIERGWALSQSCALGNQLGAHKIAHRGGQSHTLNGLKLDLKP